MKAPKPLEKEVLKSVLQYLRLTGWMACRLNSGGMTATHNGRRRFVRFNDTAGISDAVAVKGGVVAFIETKRPGGRLTEAQASFLEDVRRHGGLGLCVSSVDDLRRQLEEAGL